MVSVSEQTMSPLRFLIILEFIVGLIILDNFVFNCLISYIGSYATVQSENCGHDEEWESVWITRWSNYTISGTIQIWMNDTCTCKFPKVWLKLEIFMFILYTFCSSKHAVATCVELMLLRISKLIVSDFHIKLSRLYSIWYEMRRTI